MTPTNAKLQIFISNRRAAGDTDADIRSFLASKGIQIPIELMPAPSSSEGPAQPFAGQRASGPAAATSDIVTKALTGTQRIMEKHIPDIAEKAGGAVGGIAGEGGRKFLGDFSHQVADVPGNLGKVAGAATSILGYLLGGAIGATGAAFTGRNVGEEAKRVAEETSQFGEFIGEAGGRAAPMAALIAGSGAAANAVTSIPLGLSAWRAAKSGKLVPTREDLAAGNLFDNAATAIPLFALSALGAVKSDKLLPFGLEKKFASPEIKAVAYSTQTAKSEFGDLLDDVSKAGDGTDVLDDIPDDITPESAEAAALADDAAVKNGSLRPGFGPGARAKEQMADELVREFDGYRDAARKSFQNPYNEAPWAIAGEKADDAVGELKSLVRIYGRAKNDILAKVGSTDVPGLEAVQDTFRQEIAERLGLALTLDDAGKASFVALPGKIPRVAPDGKEAAFLADIWDNGLGFLDDTDTVQYTDEAVDAIQSRIQKASPSGTGVKGFVVQTASPIDDTATAIAKSASSRLNKALYAAADPTYKDVNTLYSIFRSVHDKLSKALGPEGSRAENLMVRTFSRTGGATRQLFKDVQTITGRDLIKEATFAKAAMEEVGDLRAFGLPETIVGDIAKGKPGLAGRMMEKIFGSVSRTLKRAGDTAALKK